MYKFVQYNNMHYCFVLTITSTPANTQTILPASIASQKFPDLARSDDVSRALSQELSPQYVV